MRLDLFSMKRPPVAQQTRTFEDPLQEGVTFTLTLRSTGDFNESMRIGELANKYIADYVTDPTPLPLGDSFFLLTESLCNVIAALEVMQVAEDGVRPYELLEWCLASVMMPTAFGEISAWSVKLRETARGKIKNAPRAGTDTVSVPPSTTEPATTPS